MTDSPPSKGKWSARMSTALRRIAQPIPFLGSDSETYSVRKNIPVNRITTSALPVESPVRPAAVMRRNRSSPSLPAQPIAISSSDNDGETHLFERLRLAFILFLQLQLWEGLLVRL